MSRRRQWQLFIAPGQEDEPLPIDSSPWHDGHIVRIPKEHWQLILSFAESLDPEKAKKLEEYSYAPDNNEYDYVYASINELESLLVFVEELNHQIEIAPPLVPEATEEIPDEYENEEHIRMLQAVASVFQESMRLQQPFRAWVD